MIKWIKSYFTLRMTDCLFVDKVSGLTVCSYVDCYGDRWMKDSRWSLFRVAR